MGPAASERREKRAQVIYELLRLAAKCGKNAPNRDEIGTALRRVGIGSCYNAIGEAIRLLEQRGMIRVECKNKTKRLYTIVETGKTCETRSPRYTAPPVSRTPTEYGYDPKAGHAQLLAEVEGTLPRIYEGQDIVPRRDYRRMHSAATWAPGASSMATTVGE